MVHPERPTPIFKAPYPPKCTDICKFFEILRLIIKIKGKALSTKTHGTEVLGQGYLYKMQDHMTRLEITKVPAGKS